MQGERKEKENAKRKRKESALLVA